MSLFNKKYVVFVTVTWLAGLVCLLAFYFLLLQPRSIRLKGLSAEYEKKQRTYEGLSAENVSAALAEVRKARESLGDYVVPPGRSQEIPLKIRTLASDSRLLSFTSKDNNSSATSPQNSFKNVSEQRMQVSFTSDYMGFASFLYAIESNRPVVFVDGFNVGHDSQDSLRVNASMDLTTLCETR